MISRSTWLALLIGYIVICALTYYFLWGLDNALKRTEKLTLEDAAVETYLLTPRSR